METSRIYNRGTFTAHYMDTFKASSDINSARTANSRLLAGEKAWGTCSSPPHAIYLTIPWFKEGAIMSEGARQNPHSRLWLTLTKS